MNKNSTPIRSHTSISNSTISTSKTKTNKLSQKTSLIQQSTKNIVVQGTDRNIGVPSTTTSNHTPRIAIKNDLLLSVYKYIIRVQAYFKTRQKLQPLFIIINLKKKKNEKKIKKPKIQSRSNTSSSLDINSDE